MSVLPWGLALICQISRRWVIQCWEQVSPFIPRYLLNAMVLDGVLPSGSGGDSTGNVTFGVDTILCGNLEWYRTIVPLN